ncbi:hypothetical protein AcidC75_18410 [Acidisoma sp. C75]
MHWIGAYAIGCMILSGWAIYDAAPSLPFHFPHWAGWADGSAVRSPGISALCGCSWPMGSPICFTGSRAAISGGT